MQHNDIQFRHGMSSSEFIAQYGTEVQCEQAPERARWPDEFVCPEYGAGERQSGDCRYVPSLRLRQVSPSPPG